MKTIFMSGNDRNKKKVFLAVVFSSVVLCTSLCVKCATRSKEGQKKASNETSNNRQGETGALELIMWCDSVGRCEPNDSIVKIAIKRIGIQHQHLVYAQMRLESGNYTSALSRINNNMFGMKHPKVRATLSCGERNGYAVYGNWCYSIVDYAIWQRMYANDLSEHEYLEMLGNYAEDKDYIEKVRRIAKSFGKY